MTSVSLPQKSAASSKEDFYLHLNFKLKEQEVDNFHYIKTEIKEGVVHRKEGRSYSQSNNFSYISSIKINFFCC